LASTVVGPLSRAQKIEDRQGVLQERSPLSLFSSTLQKTRSCKGSGRTGRQEPFQASDNLYFGKGLFPREG
jgi:hypothetical protein